MKANEAKKGAEAVKLAVVGGGCGRDVCGIVRGGMEGALFID